MPEYSLYHPEPKPTGSEPPPDEEWRQALTRATRRSALDRERELYLHLEETRNPNRFDRQHSR